MMKVYKLKVFTDENGDFGDTATVIFDEGRKIPDEKRMEIARQLNTGETVFVNDTKSRNISVIHPQGEIDFAGVAALGAAWLFIEIEGQNIDRMATLGSLGMDRQRKRQNTGKNHCPVPTSHHRIDYSQCI